MHNIQKIYYSSHTREFMETISTIKIAFPNIRTYQRSMTDKYQINMNDGSIVKGNDAINKINNIVHTIHEQKISHIHNNTKTNSTKQKIILLWATIRPDVFKQTHNEWIKNASGNYTIHTRVAVDTQAQANQLNGFDVIITNNTTPGVCYPCYCLSSTLKTNSHDIIIYASDDFFPPKNWDEFLINKFKTNPKSMLVVNDGIQKYPNNVITIPIMTYEALVSLNHTIYHPSYTHMYSDVELYDVCNRMGILNDIRNTDSTVFEHRHYCNGKRKKDTHDSNLDNSMENGLTTYKTRKKQSPYELVKVDQHIVDKVKQIPSYDTIKNLSSPILSILICTTTDRKHFLDRLLDTLNKQINNHIEVHIESDNGTMKIGKKRNMLLDKANGDYVCFVDDDDLVSDDYCAKILSAVETNPDCCSLEGLYTINGENPTLFRHSLKYNKWETANEDGKTVYYRCPNHLNAIKRELALKVRFDDNKSNGEDKDFSDRVRPLLQTESIINGVIYHYLYLQVKKGY